MMKSIVVVGLMVGALSWQPLLRDASAQTVAPCTSNCAQLTVGDGSGSAGGTVTVPISFDQAPSNGQAGGPDEIAAIAFSLEIPGGDDHPLRLANCAIGSDGLPESVEPSASLNNFRVVVENATCTGGRTHCLCPDGGSSITPDNFINIVVYGPNPLPTPGPGPIEIPILPEGKLLDITFAIEGGAPESIPLHVVNEVTDTERPPFRAFLSIGDREAVDQTCVPVSGTPPCGGSNPVSQIVIDDGVATIQNSCLGDCDGSGDVTVDEIVTMVNIALGNQSVSVCSAADGNNDGQVTVDEIITAVNIALNGCPSVN